MITKRQWMKTTLTMTMMPILTRCAMLRSAPSTGWQRGCSICFADGFLKIQTQTKEAPQLSRLGMGLVREMYKYGATAPKLTNSAQSNTMLSCLRLVCPYSCYPYYTTLFQRFSTFQIGKRMLKNNSYKAVHKLSTNCNCTQKPVGKTFFIFIGPSCFKNINPPPSISFSQSNQYSSVYKSIRLNKKIFRCSVYLNISEI